VPERYLDDRTHLKGTRLKLLCRLNCLPVMDRVGREVIPKWPKSDRVCFVCGCGVVEDVHHFIMDCSQYADKRAKLISRIGLILSSCDCVFGDQTFERLSSETQCEIILGKRIGDPIAEDRIDRVVKRYLTKTWNMRAGVTARINTALGTAYEVQVCSLAAKAN
jgi:hypothetical protein